MRINSSTTPPDPPPDARIATHLGYLDIFMWIPTILIPVICRARITIPMFIPYPTLSTSRTQGTHSLPSLLVEVRFPMNSLKLKQWLRQGMLRHFSAVHKGGFKTLRVYVSMIRILRDCRIIGS